MKKTLISLFLLICVLTAISNVTAQSEKELALKQTETFFGKPIIKGRDVFKATDDFVLKLYFENEILTQFSILPKQLLFSSNQILSQQGDSPFLNKSEFTDVITKLESINPKGKLLYKNEIAIVTNATAHLSIVYEKAYLKYGRRVDLNLENDDFAIRWIKINYLEKSSGLVLSKEKISDNLYEIGVELDATQKVLFLVTKETFDTLIINKYQTFYGIQTDFTLINQLSKDILIK